MTAAGDVESVRAQVQRVLHSRTFETSETHRRLLNYLFEKSLSGEADRLKEYTIGVEAFGKPQSYDPQADSIVRNQASRLRQKLLDYYHAEGRADPIVLDLPKGGFRLVFEPSPARDPAPVPTERPTTAEPPVPQGRRLWAYFPWVLAGILAVACAVLAYGVAGRPRLAAGPAPAPWPLSRVLNARQQTVLVVADTNLASLRFLTGGHISLDQYLGKAYPRSSAPAGATARELRLLDYLGAGTGTSYADAANVKVLTALAGGLASKLVLRHARELRSRDLQEGNSILMGSPIVDPWVSLFQPFLNFQEDDELVSRGEKYFLNRSPRPGEQERYRWSYTTGISYGTIALVPNERHNGSVLILQGLDHCGTEAMGVFLFESESRRKLRDALEKLTPRPEEAWFEALIQAESIAGAPGRSSVVAARLIQ